MNEITESIKKFALLSLLSITTTIIEMISQFRCLIEYKIENKIDKNRDFNEEKSLQLPKRLIDLTNDALNGI